MRNKNNGIMALVGVAAMTVGILGFNMMDYVDTTTMIVAGNVVLPDSVPVSLDLTAEPTSINIFDIISATEYILYLQSLEVSLVDSFNMNKEDGADGGMVMETHLETGRIKSTEGNGLDYIVTSGNSVTATTINVPFMLILLVVYIGALTFVRRNESQFMRRCWFVRILTDVCKVLLANLSITVKIKIVIKDKDSLDGYPEVESDNDEELGEELEAEQKRYTYKRFINKMN
ncbi:MAG: hypothetical protein HDR07_09860 [Lachnospiraceae bacterium]|nr:hypothetical protein [Lachnospiraceae bacterium]